MEGCSQGNVRLIHADSAMSREGTVEICVKGFWGAVCDNGWNSLDAQVVCHQLGHLVIGIECVFNLKKCMILTVKLSPLIIYHHRPNFCSKLPSTI